MRELKRWRVAVMSNPLPRETEAWDLEFNTFDFNVTLSGWIGYRKVRFIALQFMVLDNGDYAVMGWHSKNETVKLGNPTTDQGDTGDLIQTLCVFQDNLLANGPPKRPEPKPVTHKEPCQACGEECDYEPVAHAFPQCDACNEHATQEWEAWRRFN